MATTRIIPMHRNKGKTIAQSISDRTAYAMNPVKTNGGELVTCYECDARMVESEFMLSKHEYQRITGRTQDRDIIAYQIRQSFKPGDVSPEDANRIGYELAMRLLKGQHAFVISTHIDKNHIHNHIIWNSTALDSTRKFRNFWGSTSAIRQLSDLICLEHKLSVVENPSRSGMSYNSWLGDKSAPSKRAVLKQDISRILQHPPATFDAFLHSLQQSGYIIKRGKNIALRKSSDARFIRLSSLGDGFSESDIRRLCKPRYINKSTEKKVSLLIDIQQRLHAGKGPGFERWAKVFNLKQMAQTINYLSNNQIADYEALTKRASEITQRFNTLTESIKSQESKMAQIEYLKGQIINYLRSSEVYAEYRKSGYSKAYLSENERTIATHKAAKQAFDSLGIKKLPTVKSLQDEYNHLINEKKTIYSEFIDVRKDMKEILTAKANVDRLLGLDMLQQGERRDGTLR